jgi:molecular chaperone GrpE
MRPNQDPEKDVSLDNEENATSSKAASENLEDVEKVSNHNDAYTNSSEESEVSKEELEIALSAAQEMIAQARQEIDTISKERDTWRSKAESIFQQYNRLKDDMSAYRRRTERDLEDKIDRSKAESFRKLLDVLDNFDRFIQASEKTGAETDKSFQSFFKGVTMIHRQLLDCLAREGVEVIQSPVGQMMNPEFHEAVAAQDGGGEHGTVVEELQKGFTYKGSVLRATKVKVIR